MFALRQSLVNTGIWQVFTVPYYLPYEYTARSLQFSQLLALSFLIHVTSLLEDGKIGFGAEKTMMSHNPAYFICILHHIYEKNLDQH